VSARDKTRLGGIGEIGEDEATGVTALAYRQIRAVLGVPFVPTIYRMLATHQQVLVASVERLEPLLRTQRARDFGHEAQRVARVALPNVPASGSRIVSDQKVSFLLDRYSAANPLNLLFVLGLLGTSGSERSGVMSPPLPARSDDVWADILACHGGVTTPGFWREFGQWPELLGIAWSATREQAERGGFDQARNALLALGTETVRDTRVDALLDEIDPAEATQIYELLSWFPTGITTMIAEVEWLRSRY